MRRAVLRAALASSPLALGGCAASFTGGLGGAADGIAKVGDGLAETGRSLGLPWIEAVGWAVGGIAALFGGKAVIRRVARPVATEEADKPLTDAQVAQAKGA